MPSLRHNLTPSKILVALDTHGTPGVSYIAHAGQATGDYTLTQDLGTRPAGIVTVDDVGAWFIAFTVELGAQTSGFSNEVSTQVGHL
jgi:hypothetical protein